MRTKKEEKEPKKKTVKEKVTKEETKKEKKVTKRAKKEEKGLLSVKDQKCFKVISHIISIIARVAKILFMIAAPIMIIVMIMIPFVFSRLEISSNIIKYDGLRFVMNDDYITMHIGDKSYLVADEIKNLDEVSTFLRDNSLGKIVSCIELSIIFSVAIIIINIYLFTNIEKLFKNFYLEKTPFTDDNTSYIYKIARLMIYSFIVTILAGIIIELASKNIFKFNFSTYGLIEILVAYVAYYIFKYATLVQRKTDTKICD